MPVILAEPLKTSRKHQGQVGAAMEVRLTPSTWLDDQALGEFCSENRDLRIEQTAAGDLIIIAPTFSESGWHNAELAADLTVWARKTGGGRVFGASAGFRLPNGAVRAPDVSWISQERLGALSPEARLGFMQTCPDFVLGLRSPTDRLPKVREKMDEYMENGARLGWLIDPIGQQVFIYAPGAETIRLKAPAELSGEPVLAGFTLDLRRIWH